MKKLKVLNLYAGIGGNRKLWPPNINVTAIENNKKIAKIYQDFFPEDKVIVADAHMFLLEHFKEFDFIWSSPPCPSHSKFRFMTTKITDEGHKRPIIYPDMKLYEEIIILKHYFKGNWVVENVISYYEPLIKPQEVQRHYFWSNFNITKIPLSADNITNGLRKDWEKRFGFDLGNTDLGHRKDQVLRNCVHPKLGLHVFNCAFKVKQKKIGEL